MLFVNMVTNMLYISLFAYMPMLKGSFLILMVYIDALMIQQNNPIGILKKVINCLLSDL